MDADYDPTQVVEKSSKKKKKSKFKQALSKTKPVFDPSKILISIELLTYILNICLMPLTASSVDFKME